MKNNRLKILFLTKWYPNRYDPMPGLFVRRQAESVSSECDVMVLYIHEDPDCPNRFEADIAEEDGVSVVRIYYRATVSKVPVIRAVNNLVRFIMAYRMGFRVIRSFQPDLIHVHVLTRTGLAGYWGACSFRIPFIISEHWSRYFRENGTYKGWVRKSLTRFVVRRSAGVITVSEKLKEAMRKTGLSHNNYCIIPNAVDIQRFMIDERGRPDTKRIIHVSCFEDKSKNITGFLQAVKGLALQRDDFVVELIGNGPDLERCIAEAGKLGLGGNMVKFPGLVENAELAGIMSAADMLVLSSNYETFGTVIIESLACGTPVVATRVGVVPEVVNETNGIIVDPGDMKALEQAMNEMLDKSRKLDRELIRASVAGRFNNQAVGKLLADIYSNLCT